MAWKDIAVSWKDHHNTIVSVFEKLFESEALVDCTLAAEGKFVKAHKIVLSACSPYLEKLLNQEYDKHPIIFLRDVRFEDLKTILKYIYCGVIKVHETRLVELLNLADALQIRGLGGNKSKVISNLEKAKLQRANSSVSKKRLFHESKLSNTPDGNETSLDSPGQSKKIRHEKRTGNVSDSSRRTNDVSEESTGEILQVKEEVIDFVPAASFPVGEEQSSSEPNASETNEELFEVKSEFEEMTITECYSEDMLLEENDEDNDEDPDAVESVLQPGDEPSTSHCNSGSSSDPFNTELSEAQDQYIVGDSKHLPPVPNVNAQNWPSTSMENSSYEEVDCTSGNEDPDDKDLENESAPSDENLQSFQCSLCSKILKNAKDLRRHYDSHSTEKRFRCTYCPATFSRSDLWKAHLRNHTGEKPYHCEYCSSSFTVLGDLKIHIRTHTGEKPYECSYCAARFAVKGNLNNHIRIHTGEKPFQCSVCSASFTQSAHLKAHVRIHHS